MGRVRTAGFVWDVLAVARPRMSRQAVAELAVLGEFRASRYPLLLLGRRRPGQSLLDALASAEGEGSIGRATARVIPLDCATAFRGDDVTEALCDLLADRGSHIAGRSFFVRAHLRGLKGRLEHQAVERALGGFLYDRGAEAGGTPTVCFDDPDLSVVVEVVGNRAGCGFLDRRARALRSIRVR